MRKEKAIDVIHNRVVILDEDFDKVENMLRRLFSWRTDKDSKQDVENDPRHD